MEENRDPGGAEWPREQRFWEDFSLYISSKSWGDLSFGKLSDVVDVT